jgi:hypothetical protein
MNQALTTHRRPAVAALGRTLAALLDWRMFLLALLTLIGLAGAAQLPLAYTFQIGIDRGFLTDRPFLQGFRDPELVTWDDSWRWSQPEAAISVPGVGQRPLLVDFGVVSHRQNHQADAPQTILRLDIGAGPPIELALRPEAARYQLYVPREAIRDGDLRIQLSTPAWRNPNDVRGDLGVAVGRLFHIDAARVGGPVPPAAGMLLAFPAAIALLWLSLRCLDFAPRRAFLLLLPLVICVSLLAIGQAPRLGSSERWAIEWGLLCLGSAVVTALLLPPLLRRLGVQADDTTVRWLMLMVVLSFALKYGGQLHPVSMPGDLQLHVNRFTGTINGQVYIPAQHRGLPFPFPNGWYIGIAPLYLTGASIHWLFELTAGVFEALTPPLFYMMAFHLSRSQRLGLLAALFFTIAPVPLMNTWWAFHTQVATGFFSNLLLALLILRWPNYRGWLTWGSLVLLFCLVFLGHIGSFINTAIVGFFVVPWLYFRARSPAERAGALQLLWAGVASGAFVWCFYYTGFWELIVEQVGGILTSGMVEVTGRKPIPPAQTLEALWYGGLILHYGFLPVVLAIVALLGFMVSGRLRGSNVPPLIWLTFAVGLWQALLPLITLSSITTRWLTFAGWGITLGTAFALMALLRRGRSGRLVAYATLGYVAWLSIVVWVNAMALNQPPIEPF